MAENNSNKNSIKNSIIRATTADWTFFDGKEVQTKETRVLYYARTVKQIKDDRAEFEALKKEGKDFLFYSDSLIKRLHALPGIPEPPAEITLEWLEAQDVKNLEAVLTAIDEADSPKSKAV